MASKEVEKERCTVQDHSKLLSMAVFDIGPPVTKDALVQGPDCPGPGKAPACENEMNGNIDTD